jgi:hypothetical protein
MGWGDGGVLGNAGKSRLRFVVGVVYVGCVVGHVR